MADPTFLPIGEWGGTPNGWPAMTLPAVAVQVHHSVTNEDIGVNPTDDAVADFLELDAIGLSRGHGGISYSYAIHPSGIIGEGQGTRRGAHTAGDGCGGSPWGWNPCSLGVVFVGNFDPATGGDAPTPAAIQSFRWLRAVLIASGVLEAEAIVRGHRDAPGNATGCPGDTLEAALPLLRQSYNPAPPPTLTEGCMHIIQNNPASGGDGKWYLATCNGLTEIPAIDAYNFALAGIPHSDQGSGPVIVALDAAIDRAKA